jgi:hypothetical protein
MPDTVPDDPPDPESAALGLHSASVGLALQPRPPAVRRITPPPASAPDCCSCR